MKPLDFLPLMVGIPGRELEAPQREVLERVRPAGIILFARNIESVDQTRALVGQLRDLEPTPLIAADLEGGLVNRLEVLWGQLPAPAAAAMAGRRAVRALGEAAGAACRSLGIHLDLAPVVDLDCPDGCLGEQGRCFSDDPDRIAVLAGLFNEGLKAWGVSGCTKHFPGLGAVPADTHLTLPVLELDESELTRHLRVFEALGREFPAVMMAHVVVPALGDAERPASLSRSVVERAAALPGAPVILTDDLDMGALAGQGDLPELVAAALTARNHGVLICKSFERLDDVVEHLGELAGIDPTIATRLGETGARMGTLCTEVRQRSAAVPAPDHATVAQLWEKARDAAG